MSEDGRAAGPPPEPSEDLSIKTIMEQQRIIDTLREIVAAMKERVATLEAAAARAQPPAAELESSDTAAAHEKTIERLSHSVEQLTGERDAARAKCAALRAALEEEGARRAEVLAQCARLQRGEDDWRATRSLLNFAESRCKGAEMRCRLLEDEMDAVSFERSRWRALAVSVVDRLDTVARERAQLHIAALERDERVRAASRPAGLKGGGNASPALGNDAMCLDSPGLVKLITTCGARGAALLPSLPRGADDDGITVSSSTLKVSSNGGNIAGGSARRKGNRFLVPM